MSLALWAPPLFRCATRPGFCGNKRCCVGCSGILIRLIGTELKLSLSDGEAHARFYREADEHALTYARLMDSELLLVTNTLDLTSDEVVKRYKSLVNIERRFRVLNQDPSQTAFADDPGLGAKTYRCHVVTTSPRVRKSAPVSLLLTVHGLICSDVLNYQNVNKTLQ
jgi:hypothetical protein